ncbi:MAG: winged helix-turn-helix transcriptional regulator [Spirochaetes bacterium]|nr:winged helix-turn-helix transcriptional regulator [Spirochaetota bacterium]
MDRNEFKLLTGKYPTAFELMRSLHEFGKYRFRPSCESGINQSEFQVLHCILHETSRGNKSVTITEIAKFLEIAVPTVTPLIKSLAQKKLIVREKDESDRRICRIRLSERGVAFQKEEFTKGLMKFQSIVTHLGEDEVSRFISILKKTALFMKTNFHQNSGSSDTCQCGGKSNND